MKSSVLSDTKKTPKRNVASKIIRSTKVLNEETTPVANPTKNMMNAYHSVQRSAPKFIHHSTAHARQKYASTRSDLANEYVTK
jgi:hypothetical protein